MTPDGSNSPPQSVGRTTGRAAIAAAQAARLADLWPAVLGTNRFWQTRFAGIDFDPQRDPISRLPLTTRHDLHADQLRHPPYGTNLTHPLDRYARFHQTSGSAAAQPMRWLDTPEDWNWWRGCWATIYAALELRTDDRLFFPFSFGPFVGFWGAFDGAAALGRLCIPGGGMTTSQRLHVMLDNRATIVACTPSYALRMAEVAAAENIDLPSSPVRGVLVAGEPGGSVPSTRERIERAWGARLFDHWGMTEVGPLTYERADTPGGLFINEAECIAECIDPATGASVPDGQLGELVITNLGRRGSPVFRYRTGDQVRLTAAHDRPDPHAFLPGGILGRTDDMFVIRGNNVFPSVIEDILRRIPAVVEYRLVVTNAAGGNDLRLEVEPAPGIDPGVVSQAVTRAVRDRLYFSPNVSTAAPGSLPRFELKGRRLVRETSRPSSPEM